MEKETTAARLKQIMNERNIRQVDILNLVRPYCDKYGVKMNKSDISQYCSGKFEPNQEKLFVLAAGLNVSEAWLMGFDVPVGKCALWSNCYQEGTAALSPDEQLLLDSYRSSDDDHKRLAFLALGVDPDRLKQDIRLDA